jgi:hypothetical protein
MSPEEVRQVLERLELPVTVRGWEVESGPDWAGKSAVWVWAILKDEDFDLDPEIRADVRERIREAVRLAAAGEEPWVYVRFRAESETSAA